MSSSPSTTMGNMPGMKGMAGMPGMRGGSKSTGAAKSLVTHDVLPTASHATKMVMGMGMGTRPPVDVHSALTVWEPGLFPRAVALVLILIGVWYVVATRRLGARGRHWSRWRTVSFLASLVAVEAALGSFVAVLTNFSFSAHVVQHLLLMVLAPPLAALGAPMTLALQTSKRSTKRVLLRGLHSRPFALISHPVPVFFLYYLSMYAFFLTGALNYAMTHMWLMDVINLGFLGGATLFWWPMVGLDPIPHWRMTPGFKLLNLLIGVPVESFLGIALMMMGAPAASMYTVGSTHYGGGVLWVGTELATFGALIPIFAQWSRADLRNARRVDASIAAGHGMAPPVFEGHGMAATFKALRRG